MEKFRQELKQSNKFNSQYYDELFEIIDRYVESKPDITIETCKSVLEGLSRLVLQEIEQVPESELHNKKLPKTFKDARACLQKEWEGNVRVTCGYDDEFLSRFGGLTSGIEQILNTEIVSYIGTLRSGHGDISHGRSPFKEQVNDSDLAELIVGITDSITTYMLRKLNQFTEDKLLYDDNPTFNRFLDEAFPIDGVVSYSKALFEQDKVDYEGQLEDYKLEREYDLPGDIDSQQYDLPNDYEIPLFEHDNDDT